MTVTLLEFASATSDQTGDAFNSDGASFNLDIQADNFGTGGKIIIEARANDPDMDWKTLQDPNTVSGLAEYSANTVVYIDRLAQGMQFRAKYVYSSGAATNCKVKKAG